MDIFNIYYSEDPSVFSFLMLSVWCGSAAPAVALELIRLGGALRPRGAGRLAHPPSATALLSHSRCQAAQRSPADSCLLPSLLPRLQSGLPQLPDVCKEQCVELGLQACEVAFQGGLGRKATADRSWAGQ